MSVSLLSALDIFCMYTKSNHSTFDLQVFCFLFIRRGPTKWRDGFLPMDLLDDWIKSKGLPEAEWAPDGRSVTIDGDVYSIDQFGEAKSDV